MSKSKRPPYQMAELPEGQDLQTNVEYGGREAVILTGCALALMMFVYLCSFMLGAILVG